ncbi:MAG: hypothetical protein ACI4EN_08715, partial [Butyrivibrio sp.]
RNLFYVLDLSKGNHEIYFRYVTPGWYEGLKVTVISLVILILALNITFIISHKKKKSQLSES